MSYNISTKAARILSTLFVPPSFTIIVFSILAFQLEETAFHRTILILAALVFGFIFPVIMFATFRKKEWIADIDAKRKEERTFPFLLSVLFYAAGLILLISFKIDIVSIAFWFCYISNTLLLVIINKYWKISAHMIGASGPFAVLTYVFGLAALPFIILLFFIGQARIKLECHTLNQVLAGAILGFASTFVQITLITKYFGYA